MDGKYSDGACAWPKRNADSALLRTIMHQLEASEGAAVPDALEFEYVAALARLLDARPKRTRGKTAVCRRVRPSRRRARGPRARRVAAARAGDGGDDGDGPRFIRVERGDTRSRDAIHHAVSAVRVAELAVEHAPDGLYLTQVRLAVARAELRRARVHLDCPGTRTRLAILAVAEAERLVGALDAVAAGRLELGSQVPAFKHPERIAILRLGAGSTGGVSIEGVDGAITDPGLYDAASVAVEIAASASRADSYWYEDGEFGIHDPADDAVCVETLARQIAARGYPAAVLQDRDDTDDPPCGGEAA